ncbi:hypothetical protein NQ315_012521 [Exocentrus adspersus]|uniref:Tyr recombinase domain-containing protein n=1 Tax=Exocentrus adspersus TaxID=1586481 RepID=A0AAV8VCS9_9CUCU|nr:hypothetical protein NQ315_012521 [Exocentrus adspersus]
MSSDEELMDCTPPEIRQAADAAAHGLAWCKKKTYFGEQTRQKKPSTLWAMYSMIQTMLQIEEKTDISKHGKLLAFLKRQNVGFRPKKSNVYSRKNIENFLNKAPNNLLPIKVALIIGVSGACRTDELVKMKMLDVAFFEEKISVEIPDSKTHK